MAGPAVRKYLLPREAEFPVITVRRHPAVLTRAVTRAMGGLLVAAVMSAAILHGNNVLLSITWLLWAILALRLAWGIASWFVNYFAVTAERVMLTSGLATRKVESVPLGSVTDLTIQRSFAGRMIGYGTLIMESAAAQHEVLYLDYAPYPEQLYLEIYNLITPPAVAEEKPANPAGTSPPGAGNNPEPSDRPGMDEL